MVLGLFKSFWEFFVLFVYDSCLGLPFVSFEKLDYQCCLYFYVYICFMYYIYERLLYILSLLFKSFILDFLCLGFCKFWLVLSLLFIRVVFILFLQFHLCFPACLFSLCRLVIPCSVFFFNFLFYFGRDLFVSPLSHFPWSCLFSWSSFLCFIDLYT